ncbi:FlgK family flagellar hook-associated protein [Acidocella facilis]|uniref:FlgK family flagellar hook-associated protein n=1 Tax=Acidocella facilis TaxID=525 RepID=UPI00047C04B1|nr:flagellar basal body rod C-terminal domain-containing protein [Acidocella facilis]
MSGLTNAVNAALSGLQLFEAGISTVSNNLANANAAGYTVENVNAQTAQAAAGQPGAGVLPAQITRAASGFAASQLRTANSASAAASAQSTALTGISNALTNNGNVQTAINQFFSDIGSLAASPSSSALRQTVLSDAGNVVGTFQTAATSIASVVSGQQTGLSSNVTAANQILQQLSTLNKSLQTAPNSPSLLDQRDSALNALSHYLPVNIIPQSDGGVVVATGGTVLVDQSGVQALAVAENANGQTTLTAGNNQMKLTLGESDGSLGATLANIAAGGQATQSLSALAAVFSAQVNTAQAQGLTPTGTSGTPIFSVPAPSVAPSGGNSGSAVITASLSNEAALPANGGPFTLTYNSTSGWSAVDQANGQSYIVSGTPPAFAGLALSISGTANNGDSFTVNPAPGAANAIAVAATTPNDIAAADPYVATNGTLQTDGSVINKNAGTINVGTDSVTSSPASGSAVVPASYYGQNLLLTFTSASAYNVSTLASPGTIIASGTLGSNGGNVAVAYPSGLASGQYWNLPLTGAPVAGDTLSLSPGGSASGSNAQRLANLWTATGTTSSGTLEQSFVGLSTDLGANAAAAQALATSTGSQVTTATSNLATIAGVNSDQQAVLMTNYEQAYQAAAKAISAANTMFDSLLNAI